MRPAVLFDMNGVIVDDEDLHEQAFRPTLASVSVALTHADYLACFAGLSDTTGLSAFLESRDPSLFPIVDDLQRAKTTEY